MHRFSHTAICLFVPAILCNGCGDDEWAYAPPPPQLANCKDNWQVVTSSPRPFSPPSALRYHAGELIYSACSIDECYVAAEPVQGGDPRRIVTGLSGTSLWLEDDQILFANNGQLWQVPILGGTPTQVITNTIVPDLVVVHALTPTALLWANATYDAATLGLANEIWSTPRDGTSASSLLGRVTKSGLIETLEQVGDAVLVAGQGPTGVVVPLDGGPMRQLADAGFRYAGADPQGVYGWTQTGADSYAMRLAPIDGSPAQSFWPTLPALGVADRIWPDDNGGWFAVVLERFDDGNIHRSAFFLDQNERATRVACDPDPKALDGLSSVPAITDDGAYVVSEILEDPANARWEIVKVPRPSNLSR